MDTECPDQRPKLDLPCAEAQQAAVAGIPTVDTNRVTQAVMSACINSISPEWPNHVRLAAICQETLAQSALAVKDGHPRIAAVLEEASRDATLHDAFAHSASSASALRLGDVATSRLIQADIQQLREEITELQSAQQEVIAQRTAIKQRQASVQKFGEAASTADAAPVHAQCTEDPSALPQAAVAGQDRDNNVRALQVSCHLERCRRHTAFWLTSQSHVYESKEAHKVNYYRQNCQEW
jgi:hypothetical protein